MRRILLLPALLLAPAALRGQGALDEYIALGLRENLSIQQQALAVSQREAALREARGNFLPSATLNARYTDVRGQVVNLGELINPAFGALNQLLGSPQFPTDIDLRLPLKQETALRLTQPIFQAEIYSGYSAAAAARDAQSASYDAAARGLVAQITTGYLQHLQARRLRELRTATRGVLEEQARVMERLVTAGAATPDARLRAVAELREAEQREAEARELELASAQSFNLLIGRPLTDSIVVLPDSLLGLDELPSLDAALASARDRREELRAVSAAERAADAQRRVAQGSYLPNLAVAVDYGFQGNEYRFTSDADFTLISLVASWNLFNGGRDRARVQQARLEAERFALQGEDVRRGIELQVRTAWQAAAVARQGITTAAAQREAAARSYALVRRRAEEGLAPPLELSEARTQLTAAELNEILTTYTYYQRRVELDRAAALSPRIRQ